jgi:hypothetical protein
MKTRAAVAFALKQPFEIVELDAQRRGLLTVPQLSTLLTPGSPTLSNSFATTLSGDALDA